MCTSAVSYVLGLLFPCARSLLPNRPASAPFEEEEGEGEEGEEEEEEEEEDDDEEEASE